MNPLQWLSLFSVLLPFGVGLVCFRHFKIEEKIIFLLIVVSIITEAIGFTLTKCKIHNSNCYRIYTLVEFSLFTWYYIKLINFPKADLILKIIIIPFTLVAFYDFSISGPTAEDSIATSTEAILMIIYSVLAFYFMLKEPVYKKLISSSVFWFCTAILLYFSGSLFVFAFRIYLESHSHKMLAEINMIHLVFNILFYILTSIGFWKAKTLHK